MGMGLVDNHRVCISVAYQIDYCIKKALSEIDEDAYYETLVRLTEKKMPDIRKEQNVFVYRNESNQITYR